MAENGSISNEIYNMSELREEKVKMEEPAKISGHTPQSQDFTSKVLDFLSKASNEKLGACAVGLGIATYFILGRLGLILIGVVGGVILHSTREESNAKSATSLGIETKRRKETSLEVVGRLLTWQDMRLKSDTFDSEDETTKELTIDEFRPETATALNHLVDRVIEDYVK